MSAENHTPCPACVAREKGVPLAELGVRDLWDTETDEMALPEYYEIYLDKGNIVVEYGAQCRHCGYTITLNHKQQLPQP